jgi:ATP-dependent Clp protease protease subunit
MKTEDMEINIFDKNGELKDKETVLKETAKVYDDLAEEQKPVESEFSSSSDLFTTPELQVDISKTFETHDFYCRNIYITDEITKELCLDACKTIDFYEDIDNKDGISTEERKPINIIINSSGGGVIAAYMLIDKMKNSLTPVNTITIGEADSAACLIAISGTKRFANKHSSFLIHQGQASISNEAGKVVDWLNYYNNIILKQMKEHILEDTKISKVDYDNKVREDWYLTANEALKYGLIDEIIGG